MGSSTWCSWCLGGEIVLDLCATMRIVVLLCVVLFGCASSDDTAAQAPGPVPLGRLPAGVRPTHYALELTVVPDEERFSGTVRIDVALERQQRALWLHGNDLKVSEAV